jgi:hypothetical protein
MYSLYEDLTEICETLSEELRKSNSKLERTGGSLSIGDLDYIDKLTHALKSVKTIKSMVEKEGMNSSFDSNGYSSRRGGGRSYDSNMGNRSYGRYPYTYGDRYMRDYSGDEEMLSELRELMQEAPNEETKREFEKFINKIQSM